MSRLPLFLTGLVLAAPAVAQQASFSDQTASAGLSFRHTIDPTFGGNPMISGGAVGDFNNDGWSDIFVLGGGGREDALFISQQNGKFVDQAAAWGLNGLHLGAGAVAGDINGDGLEDLYVLSHGPAGQLPEPGHHKLLLNTGGAFVDIGVSAGVNFSSVGTADGMSAAMGDYDLDGDLDICVASWVFQSGGNILYRNNGDLTFTDVTAAAGLNLIDQRGFVPSFVDMNDDRYPELLFIADFGTSEYWINDGDGTFSLPPSQPDRFWQLNGMGQTVADFDNDLDLDFYATSIWWGAGTGTGNGMYWNDGNHVFQETAEASGVDAGHWGWGTVALDCENDGWLDIFETNGWQSQQFRDNPDVLFVNNHDQTFTEMAQAAGISHRTLGKGVMRLDYDQDGDEDLIAMTNNDFMKLYRNDAGSSVGNWLQVVLDTSANPRIAPGGFNTYVYARRGTEQGLRYMDAGPSYTATSERLLHFGLEGLVQVDEVRVHWADDSWTYVGRTAANQRITVASGLPIRADELRRGAATTLSMEGANPGEWVLFLYSMNGLRAGACPPPLGGMCYDLAGPVRYAGSAVANAIGEASVTIPVPATAPLQAIGIQAVVPRGVNGADSLKTNALLRTILP
ncbi:MAG TPA: CRTAC1 family protein [Planctomycetota bacterium]